MHPFPSLVCVHCVSLWFVFIQMDPLCVPLSLACCLYINAMLNLSGCHSQRHQSAQPSCHSHLSLSPPLVSTQIEPVNEHSLGHGGAATERGWTTRCCPHRALSHSISVLFSHALSSKPLLSFFLSSFSLFWLTDQKIFFLLPFHFLI